MLFPVLAAIATLAMLGVLARLWWLLRERTRRRRAVAWRRWWAAYRLRLPATLMARWARGRLIAHRVDPAA